MHPPGIGLEARRDWDGVRGFVGWVGLVGGLGWKNLSENKQTGYLS